MWLVNWFQLENAFQFFKTTFQFPLDENWTFVKTMMIGKNEENVCKDCSNHVLDSDSILDTWWIHIIDTVKVKGIYNLLCNFSLSFFLLFYTPLSPNKLGS